MMNKQLAFVKGGLGFALCFLMVGAGSTSGIPALICSNPRVQRECVHFPTS